MEYKVVLRQPLKWRNRKGYRVTIDPGVYFVPSQMDPKAAELAVSQGIATKHEMMPPALPKVERAAEALLADTVSVQEQSEPRSKRGRRRRRKGPAPENRAMFGAPEDKQAVH